MPILADLYTTQGKVLTGDEPDIYDLIDFSKVTFVFEI